MEEEIKVYEKTIASLRKKHYFLLVEEAENFVLSATRDAKQAAEWFEKSAKNQNRWFNPGVYVYHRKVVDDNVPEDAAPILSTYHYLTREVSNLRNAYLTRFPNKYIMEAGRVSL